MKSTLINSGRIRNFCYISLKNKEENMINILFDVLPGSSSIYCMKKDQILLTFPSSPSGFSIYHLKTTTPINLSSSLGKRALTINLFPNFFKLPLSLLDYMT